MGLIDILLANIKLLSLYHNELTVCSECTARIHTYRCEAAEHQGVQPLGTFRCEWGFGRGEQCQNSSGEHFSHLWLQHRTIISVRILANIYNIVLHFREVGAIMKVCLDETLGDEQVLIPAVTRHVEFQQVIGLVYKTG